MWCQNTQEKPKTCLGEEEEESRELENPQKRTLKNLVKLFQNINLEDSSSIHYRLPWHRNTLGTIKALT